MVLKKDIPLLRGLYEDSRSLYQVGCSEKEHPLKAFDKSYDCQLRSMRPLTQISIQLNEKATSRYHYFHLH